MKVCYAHEKLDKLRWNILNAVFILLCVSLFSETEKAVQDNSFTNYFSIKWCLAESKTI